MKKPHTEPSLKEDIISKLPNEILAHILTELPIEDAVRTSSLSKRWRHVYTEMPRLQFIMKDSTDGCASNECLSIIDRLLDRIGPSIETFILLHKLDHHASHVNRFINRLQNKSIKVLFIINKSAFGIPVQVFSQCRTLVNLCLVNCRVQIPDGFVGFPCLKFLRVFSNTSVETYRRLISTCPRLEKLCILVCCDSPCTTLQIGDLQHLKLLMLGVHGGLLKVQGLELIPPLQKVELIVGCWQGGRPDQEDVVAEFFKRGVRRLSLVTHPMLDSTIIEATFLNLTCVTIKMDFTDLEAMEGFCRILRNAPKLQEISLKVTTAHIYNESLMLLFIRMSQLEDPGRNGSKTSGINRESHSSVWPTM
ncbi:putative F-box/FBD/LRR-repeat protein [Acorus calamus]|uniref:F-box/FBD/LRR-repeat protein n=1 Tax=Acorus calamus TaxID=4465 RepID=A0AAV9DF04_ACOCL|nr:putative F-box/FBD/LRR-repeat protein [Acorus calamus]